MTTRKSSSPRQTTATRRDRGNVGISASAGVPRPPQPSRRLPPAPRNRTYSVTEFDEDRSLTRLLATLTPQHREILAMRVIYGYSAQETATALGLPSTEPSPPYATLWPSAPQPGAPPTQRGPPVAPGSLLHRSADRPRQYRTSTGRQNQRQSRRSCPNQREHRDQNHRGGQGGGCRSVECANRGHRFIAGEADGPSTGAQGGIRDSISAPKKVGWPAGGQRASNAGKKRRRTLMGLLGMARRRQPSGSGTELSCARLSADDGGAGHDPGHRSEFGAPLQPPNGATPARRTSSTTTWIVRGRTCMEWRICLTAPNRVV